LKFLRLNGREPAQDSLKWGELTLDVAVGRSDRDHTTKRLRKLLRKGRG
jgi:prophage maintenance system killer protein